MPVEHEAGQGEKKLRRTEFVANWLMRVGVVGGIVWVGRIVATQLNPGIAVAIAANPILNYFFGRTLLPRSIAGWVVGWGLKGYVESKKPPTDPAKIIVHVPTPSPFIHVPPELQTAGGGGHD